MITTTLCPTLRWQTCTKTMEKIWGFSSQSSQPTSLVGENKHFIETDIVKKGKNKKKKHKNLGAVMFFFFCSHRLFFCCCCSPSKQRIIITVIFIIIWQVLQTLATYHTRCQVSILSSISAQTRWTTPRNTPKQQVRQHASIQNRCCPL